LNEFPAAVLIQERRVTSNTSEVKCPNSGADPELGKGGCTLLKRRKKGEA